MRKQYCLFIILYILWSGTYAQCRFTVSDENPCATETVTLEVENPTQDATYSWDIDGDGIPETNGSTFFYEFPESYQDSTYEVVLYENGDSCFATSINVMGIPDASIGIAPGIIVVNGNELKACNGAATIDLDIFNASQTIDDNISYTIDWGDDSPAETFDNNTFSPNQTISHTYMRLGYFTIFVTVERANGCAFTTNYVFYNGGNPSVGLVNPGNTVGLCAPATLDFPITNTENNPPGTEYTIYVNGEVVDTFSQENVPSIYSYTFENNSCGVRTTNGSYVNAFDLRIVASNPCNSSAATVEPIEVTARPEPDIAVTAPLNLCAGETYTFEDLTSGIVEVISGNPSSCIDVLSPTWSISGTADEDWTVGSGSLFGSSTVEVEFLKPGVYTVELTIVSFSCGPLTVSREITIFAPPELSPSGNELPIDPNGNGGVFCAPIRIDMPEVAKGDSLSYTWSVTPATGWELLDSTTLNSAQPSFQFNEGGVYDIQAVVQNPCSASTWTGTVRIPGPPTAQIGPLPDFCQTATINFDSTNVFYTPNDAPITGVSWRFPGANTVADKAYFPKNIQYDSVGTYIIELMVENACGSNTVYDTIVVQEPTTLMLPVDTAICDNSERFRLRAQPGGGTWSGPGVINGRFFDPQSALPGQNTLTYTFGVGACFSQASFTITILPSPVVDAGPDLSICPADPAVNLVGTPSSGQWIINDSLFANNYRFDPAVNPPGNYQFLFQATNAQGCTAQDTAMITVLAAPTLVVSDTSYCNTPGQVPLPNTNVAGVWSGPGVVSGTNLFDPFAAGGAGLYALTFSATGTNGCISTASVDIGVIDPTAVNAGPDESLCANDPPLDLSAAATPPGGRWLLNNQRIDASFDPRQYGGGQYTLTYRVGQGNCQVEDQRTIQVASLIQLDAGPNQDICIDGDPVTITPLVGGNGNWTGTGIINTGLFTPGNAGVGTYTLEYAIVDALTGCTSTDSLNMTVHPIPSADFALPEVVCVGTAVPLVNNNNEVRFTSWMLSTGWSASGTSTQFSVQDTGQITVTMSIESTAGCTNSAQKSVLAMAAPVARMTLDETDDCLALAVNPKNESVGVRTDYQWTFGNGEALAGFEPSAPVNYLGGINDTAYVIRLTAENLCGQSVVEDSLWVRARPMVDFGFSLDTACAPVQVFFNNISQGNPESFFWDFGNGRTSTDSLPAAQEYWEDTMAVDYPITLRATNSCGVDSLTKYLTIAPQIIRSFFNVSRTSGCAPLEISLEDFSSPGTTPYWDFGDGETSIGRFTEHTFSAPGQYLVKLYSSSPCALDSSEVTIEVLEAPPVDFGFSSNTCVDEAIQLQSVDVPNVSATWIINNQDTLRGPAPSFQFDEIGDQSVLLVYEHLVTGCRNEVQKMIPIQPLPEAGFSMDQHRGCTPLAINFVNESTPGTFLQWTFGDGNGSVAPNPTHVYQDSGRYEVRLAITNEIGCVNDTVFGGVHAFPVPEAAFSLRDTVHCGLPAPIQLENESTGADGYLWTMGDGNMSTFADPLHTYTAKGYYDIDLEVENRYGCKAFATETIHLVDQPVAEFGLEELSGCVPFQATFQSGATGESFLWDFGDGAIATDRLPVHTYWEAGVYDVSLIVGNESICYDTLELSGAVEALASPTASFVWADELDGEPTGRTIFENTSTPDATTFSWDFGDGNTSAEEHPIHRFLSPDIKAVRLMVNAVNGCPDDTLMMLPPNYVGKLFVPNAFMPPMLDEARGQNGGSDAAYFLPKGYGLKEYHVQIFSTYGDLIWESFLLLDGQPAEGWDGTLNGEPLPQDVYVWKINAIFEDGRIWQGNKSVSGKYQKMGSVTLIR